MFVRLLSKCFMTETSLQGRALEVRLSGKAGSTPAAILGSFADLAVCSVPQTDLSPSRLFNENEPLDVDYPPQRKLVGRSAPTERSATRCQPFRSFSLIGLANPEEVNHEVP
jgi:hypothetical protein